MSYVDRGVGTPLLLVHGFPLDHTMWAEQIEGLSACCRVIAPDLPGFGRSPVRTSPMTMARFADDLAALLEGLGVVEPVVCCGLSMGGYIAFQFWRKHAARLRGLILCDTRAAADGPEAAAGRRSLAERVLREGAGLLAEGMLPRLLAETTTRQHPQIVDALRRVIVSANPGGVAAAALGMAERPDMTAALPEIGCPTLAIVGQQDAISPPAEMRSIAAAIRGARYVEIPAAGHMAPLENPAAVNAAIGEFLSRIGA
jgi:3-oxoadipate enol-lactonase